MMSGVATVDLGVFALKNVPDLGERVAQGNGARIEASGVDVAVVTETWGADVKAGVRVGAPSLDWWTEDGQTLMIGHNPKRVGVLEQLVLTGASSPWIPKISDCRDALAELHEDLATGAVYWVLAIHTAPIRPKMGRPAVLAAQAAHAITLRRIRRFIRRHGRSLPIYILGDFNTRRLMPNARIVGDQIGNGIVHVEFFSPATVRSVTPVEMDSDHLGVHAVFAQAA